MFSLTSSEPGSILSFSLMASSADGGKQDPEHQQIKQITDSPAPDHTRQITG